MEDPPGVAQSVVETEARLRLQFPEVFQAAKERQKAREESIKQRKVNARNS